MVNLKSILKKYKKEFAHSYSFGAFPTFELLKSKPDKALMLLVSTSIKDTKHIQSIYDICQKRNIEIHVNDKVLMKVSPKENCYIIGVFAKYDMVLEPEKPHVVLVNPSNMGNLGTIARTILGFGIKNLAIIRPGADVFDPRTVRASMGAVFKINFSYFDSFENYIRKFPNHQLYTFMLDGKTELKNVDHKGSIYSLVFGNEATGLEDEFKNIGTSVYIRHSGEIDSLNLPVAVGIAAFEFREKQDVSQ